MPATDGVKVALVYSPYGAVRNEPGIETVKENYGIFPSLSLLYVAGILEQCRLRGALHRRARGGADARRDGRRGSSAFGPEFVGYTLTTYLFFQTMDWIKAIRAQIDAPTIVGGVHLSIYPRETLGYDCGRLRGRLRGGGQRWPSCSTRRRARRKDLSAGAGHRSSSRSLLTAGAWSSRAQGARTATSTRAPFPARQLHRQQPLLLVHLAVQELQLLHHEPRLPLQVHLLRAGLQALPRPLSAERRGRASSCATSRVRHPRAGLLQTRQLHHPEGSASPPSARRSSAGSSTSSGRPGRGWTASRTTCSTAMRRGGCYSRSTTASSRGNRESPCHARVVHQPGDVPGRGARAREAHGIHTFGYFMVGNSARDGGHHPADHPARARRWTWTTRSSPRSRRCRPRRCTPCSSRRRGATTGASTSSTGASTRTSRGRCAT